MAEAISSIKEKLKNWNEADLAGFLSVYASDERSGVVSLCQQAVKKMAAYEAESQRLYELSSFERQYADYQYIGGIDEVGRGPLAGPVVTCALILPKDCKLRHINDSKKLSAKMRETLYDQILEEAVSVGIGWNYEGRIDEINILNATYEAMREAISKLSPQPDILLNDAVKIPGVEIKQVPIIKGDAKSITIGAASIVAKVTRDRFMEEMDAKYPGYGFASNKGYGSADHIKAIKEMGPCPIHRKTFIKNFI